MKIFLKKYGVYIAAALIFIAAAFVYCKPEISGKVLVSGDASAAAAAQMESFLYYNETGESTWWTGSVFSGMPNYQIGGGGLGESVNWLQPLRAVFFMGSSAHWTLIVYFICFFIMLRCFGVKPWLSIVGAFAVALSSYFFVIIGAGHGSKTITISFISVVVGAFYLIFREHKYGLGAVLTAVFVAMGYVAHPQMTYYLFMMIGLMWVAEIVLHIRQKQVKEFVLATAVFAGATLIGVGTQSADVFSNAEYVKETIRGGHSDIVRAASASEEQKTADTTSDGLDISYATEWSYGIDETMSFLIPGFMGGSNSYPLGTDSGVYKTLVKNGVGAKNARDFCEAVPMYWGDQPFTAGNVYMGAIVCFLFLLGLLVVKGPYKWALLAATVFSTALAWGHNCMWLTELFFKYMPLYSKFRAVSSILIVAEIAMPLLGFMALAKIMNGDVEKHQLLKNIYIAGGVTAGICLIFALFGGAMFSFTSSYDAKFIGLIPDWLYAAIVDERRSLLRSDSWRSFLFVAAACILVWIYAKGKIKNRWFVAVLGILIVADMWPVDKRYFNDDYFMTPKQKIAQQATKLPYEEAILKDSDPHFRVLNLTVDTYNENRTSYYLKSIGGYCAAKLRRYQDLINEHLSKLHWPVIGMLNAKYVITQDNDGTPYPQFNPYALGNAWFVDDVSVVATAAEESDALMQIDLGHQAVVGKEFSSLVEGLTLSPDPSARIHLTKYTPKYLDYESTSSRDGVAVFSEIYYPHGWKATIDGESVDIYRADYLLRAIRIPAGKHQIHFVFEPDSVKKGNTLAGISSILLYLLIFGVAGYNVAGYCKNRKRQ